MAKPVMIHLADEAVRELDEHRTRDYPYRSRGAVIRKALDEYLRRANKSPTPAATAKATARFQRHRIGGNFKLLILNSNRSFWLRSLLDPNRIFVYLVQRNDPEWPRAATELRLSVNSISALATGAIVAKLSAAMARKVFKLTPRQNIHNFRSVH